MKQAKTKRCRYCGAEFNELDYPAQFERMVTCGRISCMGARRRELREVKA